MKISKYSEFDLQNSLVEDFILGLDGKLTESESDGRSWKDIQTKVLDDLKLNTSLALTFGTGIGAFYPIVEKLMKNLSTESIDVTKHTVVLLTIAAITIIYLEERKAKSKEEQQILTRDSQSMLEELKLKGIGNGLVKKVMSALKSVKNIFSLISKHLGAIIGGFMDMLAYTALLIPIMNAIAYVIQKYDMNLETLTSNFLTLSMGIATLVAKHGISEIINRLKIRFPLNKQKIVSELETPVIQKFGDFTHTNEPQQGDLIKEQ